MTEDQFQQMLPNASPQAGVFFGPLAAAMREFDISGPLREAAFLAQVLHESAQLTRLVESCNYSPARLQAVFGKYFPSVEMACAYAGQAQKIANRVYAGRMGNGDEASGDGWRFRGRGLLQLTGRSNYRHCGAGLGLDLLANPDWLAQAEVASRSAAWFWANAHLNALADVGDTLGITRAINGGSNGLAEREALYQICLGALQ